VITYPDMDAEAPKLFFSYARADSVFALRLAKDLRSAGIQLWIDQLDICPGSRWDQAVEGALKGCSEVLVILSPASVRSNNVLDEVSFALEDNKRVVPVRRDECEIPFRLKRLQYIDFARSYDNGLTELRAALGSAGTLSLTAPSPGDQRLQFFRGPVYLRLRRIVLIGVPTVLVIAIVITIIVATGGSPNFRKNNGVPALINRSDPKRADTSAPVVAATSGKREPDGSGDSQPSLSSAGVIAFHWTGGASVLVDIMDSNQKSSLKTISCGGGQICNNDVAPGK
jgi:hypothetical protein